MKKKLLLVEDDSNCRFILKVLLQNQFQDKIEVFEAVNGFDGLNQLKNNKIDIILTDIMMPIIDGIQMLNEIRKIKDFDDLPIVALSANHVMEMELEPYYITTFLQKPVHLEKLNKLLTDILFDSNKLQDNS